MICLFLCFSLILRISWNENKYKNIETHTRLPSVLSLFCGGTTRFEDAMQSVPEGSQTAATQTEQSDASSIGGSSMRYLNSTTKSGENTHVSSSASWSGHPLSQNESPEVNEREAVTSFSFNMHATPFLPTPADCWRRSAFRRSSRDRISKK